ncbi:sideroflexin-3-like [Agrilus planipennis]|uniref:Sideroflexin-3-like n=1 Tax=Agrilus planipennis TaxID=224129 RepID=A0A7F5RHK7_AGRPL|nr:sideroflexin-3-like [Agrilus planipennis]
MNINNSASTKTIKDFDIDKPRYDMDKYLGRAKHFFIVTNPLNLFVSDKTLENAKNIVEKQRKKELVEVSEKELIKAKVIYDSAFHPETGEKQFLLGRMSAQVPVNMVLTACLTFFYKTNTAIIFWQWVNQSFNAVVNFSNRSGDSPITNQQILWSYVAATSSAVIVSLGLKRLLRVKLDLTISTYIIAYNVTTNYLCIYCVKSKPTPGGIRKKELVEVSEKELIKAKVIYDSAFHPETGEKQFLLGRMSAQVPVNMVLTACLTFFYKTNTAIIFWQWVNQSFNAVVNFSNRSGDSPITNQQILWSYVAATSSAVIVSLGLKRLLRRAPPVISRFVPFAGCAAANCVNLPMMRSKELLEGTAIYDENGQKIGQSKYAAQKGISQVVFSRVCMPMGGMVGVPTLMDFLSKRGIHFKYPFPIELSLNGLTLLFSTPLCCAFFKQYQEFPFNDLEQNVQVELTEKFKGNPPASVYFNKGL